MITDHKYYTYILTTRKIRLLYVGVTSNLHQRLEEHLTGKRGGYTQRYQCHYLIYFEEFQYIDKAIKREKEFKGWSKNKKLELIRSKNPQLEFLNDSILGS
jgi:putative endonuclease